MRPLSHASSRRKLTAAVALTRVGVAAIGEGDRLARQLLDRAQIGDARRSHSEMRRPRRRRGGSADRWT